MNQPRRLNEFRPGYWLVKCCSRCPEVIARIWQCGHEPDEPGNALDRWPPYVWRAQIGLEEVDPEQVWQRRGKAIDEAGFRRGWQWLRWAEVHAPEHPLLQYRRPMRMAELPLPSFAGDEI